MTNPKIQNARYDANYVIKVAIEEVNFLEPGTQLYDRAINI